MAKKTIKKTAKKRNPTDATMRNVRATAARLEDIDIKLDDIKYRTDILGEKFEHILTKLAELQTRINYTRELIPDTPGKRNDA